MKKSLLIVLFASFGTAAIAQNNYTTTTIEEVEVIEVTPQKPSFAGIINNKFWDNWTLSVNGGINLGQMTTREGIKDAGNKGDRLGFDINIAATKWFNPVIGTRLQFGGGEMHNYLFDATKSNPAAGPLIKWPYLNLHLDMMVDLSNWIGGYRDDRVYYAVPYVGLGYFTSCFTDSFDKAPNNAYKSYYNYGVNHNIMVNIGYINRFRLTPYLDLDLEFKYLVTGKRAAAIKASGKFFTAYFLDLGLTYRFNKRTWDRNLIDDAEAVALITEYTGAIATLENALNDSNQNEAALRAQIADLQNRLTACQKQEKQCQQDVKNVYLNCEYPIFFQINEAVISDKGKVCLDLIAKAIKSAPESVAFTVTGNADRQTGTPQFNYQLSKKRADAVKKYLVSKGVDAAKLQTIANGSKDNPFSGPAYINRVVVIK